MARVALHNASLPAPVGYSRAVLATGAQTIYTSMTAPVGAAGEVVGAGDVRRQTARVIENISDILEQNGSGLDDVVQVTVFVARCEDIRTVEDEVAASLAPPPAVSAVVTALANPDFLVEIAAVASIAPAGEAELT